MITAISREIVLRKQYIQEKVDTIYFGGGTPSLLTIQELETLLKTIYDTFDISDSPETTIETNPDDINIEKLKQWKDLGFNRLSIGVQSFNEDNLKYLNRIHSAQESLESIKLAQKLFDNYTIDLIYSIPGKDHKNWEKDLEITQELKPPHISAYNLTIEEKTVFGNWYKRGIINEVSEDFAAEQYLMLTESLHRGGYDHYEVSNFCLPGQFSRHNTSYWQGKPYLGVGPGAHSYNFHSRQYNIASNPKYIKALKEQQVPAEVEQLTREQKVNEYLLTGLRTKWGVDLSYLENTFNYPVEEKRAFIKNICNRSLAKLTENKLILTEEGFLLSDEIAIELAI